MKKIILPLVILAGLGVGAYFLFGKKNGMATTGTTEPIVVTPEPLSVGSPVLPKGVTPYWYTHPFSGKKILVYNDPVTGKMKPVKIIVK